MDTPTFLNDHIPSLTDANWNGGTKYIFEFPNGYSASVVRNKFSYGGRQGLWEIAVMFNDTIVYDTAIADDVIGYLGENQVSNYLYQISDLPARSMV